MLSINPRRYEMRYEENPNGENKKRKGKSLLKSINVDNLLSPRKVIKKKHPKEKKVENDGYVTFQEKC